MPYVDRNDKIRIYYEIQGEGDALLLSHGYSATSAMWQGQVANLCDRYRVISWDMLGHGQSSSPDDASAYSEAATVEDMAAILDQCQVERAFIGGLSLGGYMSLAFWRRNPGRVRGLLLFDTGPGYKNDAARDQWNDRAMRTATSLESKGLEGLRGSGEVQASLHSSAKGLALAARGMLAQRDDRVIRCLPEIDVPALVVVGADDRPFLAASDYMAGKIPNATKVVIPDAGHASNLDQPEVFNRAVASFLDSVAD